MKIIKYLLLWFILIATAIMVFVGVETSEIAVKKTIFLNQPKEIVLPFFANFNYWTTENFDYELNANSQNDLLFFEFDDRKYKATITIKDSLKGTKVILKTARDLSFFEKFNRMFFIENKKQYLTKFIEEQLIGLQTNLSKKINRYDFTIQNIVEIPEAYVIEKDTLVIPEQIFNCKQKLENELNLLAYLNKLKTAQEPLFYATKSATKINLKVQKIVQFDSLWRDSIPTMVTLRKPISTIKMEVQGVFSGLKKHENNIRRTLDTLDYEVISFDYYLQKDKINIENSAMPFEWLTEIYLPIQKKQKKIESSLNQLIESTSE
uniref:hypothetical protein n=1 Tax=Flavobacterium sp. TaxID=239 RepID=UPI004048EC3C